MDHNIISRAIDIEYSSEIGRRHTLVVEHRGTCSRCKEEISKIDRYSLFDDEVAEGKKRVVGFHDLASLHSGCKWGWSNVVVLSTEPENPDSPEGQIVWVMR